MAATWALAGELAGLGTALAWGISALAWGLAGRKIGAVSVTCLRITLATVILAGTHWAAFGSPFPTRLAADALWLLVASGAMGAGVGDLCFFRGLVLIGPRLGMLILSFAPFLSALIAFLTPLRESLGPAALTGMVLTVAGVSWVVADRRGRQAWQAPSGRFHHGVLLALAGTCLIAGGYVLAKMGMGAGPGGGVAPFSAALVRVAAGTAATWIVIPFLGRLRATLRAVRHGRAMLIVSGGTIIGPVVGIWLSLEALKHTPETGVAAALIGTSPIVMIPLAYLAYGEKPTFRAVAGTLMAAAGVAVLMLR